MRYPAAERDISADSKQASAFTFAEHVQAVQQLRRSFLAGSRQASALTPAEPLWAARQLRRPA